MKPVMGKSSSTTGAVWRCAHVDPAWAWCVTGSSSEMMEGEIRGRSWLHLHSSIALPWAPFWGRHTHLRSVMMTYYWIETPLDRFGAPIQLPHWSQGNCSHKARALPSSAVDMACFLLSAQTVRMSYSYGRNSSKKARP